MQNLPAVGNLYLIPTTLGNTPPLDVLPQSVKRAVESLDEFIVENEIELPETVDIDRADIN